MDISSRPSYVEASAQDALSSAESFVEKCRAMVSHLPEHKRLVEPIITPRFVPTCSNELLTGLGMLSAAKSLRIQSHLAEAQDQVEWVKRERGVDDIEVFDRVRSSHDIFLPEVDIKRGSVARTPDTANNSSALYICRQSFSGSSTNARYSGSALCPFKLILLSQTVSSSRSSPRRKSRTRHGCCWWIQSRHNERYETHCRRI